MQRTMQRIVTSCASALAYWIALSLPSWSRVEAFDGVCQNPCWCKVTVGCHSCVVVAHSGGSEHTIRIRQSARWRSTKQRPSSPTASWPRDYRVNQCVQPKVGCMFKRKDISDLNPKPAPSLPCLYRALGLKSWYVRSLTASSEEPQYADLPLCNLLILNFATVIIFR